MIAFVLSLFWASALSASSIASTGLDEYDDYENDENTDYEGDQDDQPPLKTGETSASRHKEFLIDGPQSNCTVQVVQGNLLWR